MNRAGKPLVREKLDFSRRKRELGSTGRLRPRACSAYGAIQQALDSNALLRGVPTAEVNPGYTSVIGRVKYARPLGVSVHQAAALAIARRGMGFGETALARPVIPASKGDHLIVELPASNRSMHEWLHWAKVALHSPRDPLQGGIGCASPQPVKPQVGASLSRRFAWSVLC